MWRLNESGESSEDRGISTTVGVIFILGFAVTVGIGLLLFTQGFVSVSDPKANSDFTLQTDNTTSNGVVGQVVYERGSDFTATNTEEVYMIVQGERLTLTGDDRIVLYSNGTAHYNENNNATIERGDAVLTTNASDENSDIDEVFAPGSAAQIIWVPEQRDGTEVVLDEFVVPDQSTILQRTRTGGTIVDARYNVTF